MHRLKSKIGSIALASLPCEYQSLVFYGIGNNIIGIMFISPHMVHLFFRGVSIALASFLFFLLMVEFGFDCVPYVFPCRNIVIQ